MLTAAQGTKSQVSKVETQGELYPAARCKASLKIRLNNSALSRKKKGDFRFPKLNPQLVLHTCNYMLSRSMVKKKMLKKWLLLLFLAWFTVFSFWIWHIKPWTYLEVLLVLELQIIPIEGRRQRTEKIFRDFGFDCKVLVKNKILRGSLVGDPPSNSPKLLAMESNSPKPLVIEAQG